jgi:uncharacterized membrane protein
MFPALIIFSISIAGIAVAMWRAPHVSRQNFFFGETVDPEFRSTEAARRILSRYRAITVLAATASWLAFGIMGPYLAGPDFRFFTLAAVFVLIGGAATALSQANRQTQPFAGQPEARRTASLEQRTRSLPGGWILFLGPILLVCTASLLVFANRIAIGYDALRASGSFLAVAFVTDALFLWLGYLAEFRSRRIYRAGEDELREAAYRRTHYWALLLFAYFMTMFQLIGALRTAGIVEGGTPLNTAMFVSAACMFIGFSACVFRLAAARTPAGDSTPDECWKWGFIYHNPDDAAFIVQKRIGYGWDLNFGNRWSWPAVGIILMIPIVLRVLWP